MVLGNWKTFFQVNFWLEKSLQITLLYGSSRVSAGCAIVQKFPDNFLTLKKFRIHFLFHGRGNPV